MFLWSFLIHSIPIVNNYVFYLDLVPKGFSFLKNVIVYASLMFSMKIIAWQFLKNILMYASWCKPLYSLGHNCIGIKIKGWCEKQEKNFFFINIFVSNNFIQKPSKTAKKMKFWNVPLNIHNVERLQIKKKL